VKHARKEKRKSFKKWGMSGQRVETESMERLNERRAASMSSKRNFKNITWNGDKDNRNFTYRAKSIPANYPSRQFLLHRHSIVSDPMGRGARFIASHDYHPSPKAPSRRDYRRMRAINRRVTQ
jgi:hypothetical protein